jgi:hypothetical protein
MTPDSINHSASTSMGCWLHSLLPRANNDHQQERQGFHQSALTGNESTPDCTKWCRIAPNGAGLHPAIRHIPKKVRAIRDIAAMLHFPFVILRHACIPRPFLCSSRSLSLNDRAFVFHLRAFCIRRSAVFGIGGCVLDTCECDLCLTHRLLAGHIGNSSMLSSTHRFFTAD